MKIALRGIDGSVAIMTLVEGADKEDAIKKFKEAHPGKYLDHVEGNFKMPKSREHRDAWTLSESGNVVVDKTKINKE